MKVTREASINSLASEVTATSPGMQMSFHKSTPSLFEVAAIARRRESCSQMSVMASLKLIK